MKRKPGIRKYIAVHLFVFLCQIVSAQPERAVGNIAAERKIALVIGNTNYDSSIGRLKNPVNDANDMADALKRLGFTLVGGKAQLDVNKKKMLELIREFGTQIKQGGVGFFYFSGHGVQVNKRNYIIPITDLLVYEDDAESEAVEVDAIAREMEYAENRLNILVLDACRSNNLVKRARNTGKGLAEPSRKPEGTFIAFAAGDGQTASDGSERNGLFTYEFLKNLEIPDVRLDDVFTITRNEVKRISNNRQVPIIYNSTSGPIILRSSDIAVQPPLPVNTVPSPNPLLRSESQPGSNSLNSGRKIGDTMTNSIGMQFVGIPSGEFMMGATEAEVDEATYEAKRWNKKFARDSLANEFPKHRVRIRKGFWLGTYEVTQKQWEMVMGDNPSDYKDCGGTDCPVEQVSWLDVKIFLDRLNSKDTLFTYRLPTEAEWEYACRAGTTTRFAFGDSLSSDQANFDGRYPYAGGAKGRFVKKTSPVGSYKPNAWGLYDMHGNVWEWVEDWYEKYVGGEYDDPQGPQTGTYRVIRGGEWVNFAPILRSSSRNGVKPDFREQNGVGSSLKRLNIGFRIVAVPK